MVARAARARGRPGDAVKALCQHLALDPDGGGGYPNVGVRCLLAEAHADYGDTAAARTLYVDAMEQARKAHDVRLQARCTLVLAHIACVDGDAAAERSALLDVVRAFTHEPATPRGWYELETALTRLGDDVTAELQRHGWTFAERLYFPPELLNPEDEFHVSQEQVAFDLELLWKLDESITIA